MKHALIFFLISIVPLIALSQDAKQIQSRGIRVVCTKTEQTLKGHRELSMEVTRYDKKGRETSIEYFNADSICVRTEQFTYNSKGKTIRHCIADSIEKTTNVVEQQYDRWNRLTQKTTIENNLTAERIEYAYNNFDDRISEIVYDKAGKIKKKTTFTYDSRGMLTGKTTTNAEGVITYDKSIEYTY
jgi:hypothetical protein